MLINNANNDQNIDRVCTKMSDGLSGGQNHNAKLLCASADTVNYFTETNAVNNACAVDGLGDSYDHMYAADTADNGDVAHDQVSDSNNCQSAESEVKFLKDWLILHLDLIQQQNDDILNKERTILILQQENEMLKERISCMERGSPFHSEKYYSIRSTSPTYPGETFAEDMTQDSGPSEEDNKEHIQLLDLDCRNNDCSMELKSFERDDDDNVIKGEKRGEEHELEVAKSEVLQLNNSCSEPVRSDLSESVNNKCDKLNSSDFTISNSVNSMKSIRMNIRRKRFCSNSSAVSNNDSVSEEKRPCRRLKKRRKRYVKDDSILTTSDRYVTHSGEVAFGLINEQHVAMEMAAAAADSASLEVPRWRTKVYTSCYTMEGTENLDDEVYNKRHSRLENDERRRKRWDVQRIREQRVIEKLKQRQEKSNSRTEEPNEQVNSLWPTIDDIRFLEVCDQLPVSAFGVPLPRFTPNEFSLPWLNSPHRTLRRIVTRKSNQRRRGSRR